MNLPTFLCLSMLANTREYSPMDVLLRIGLVVVLGILLISISMMIRKKLTQEDEAPPVGFTLRDLRAMHAAGQLSDEELARAEAKAAARSRSIYLGDETDAQAGPAPPSDPTLEEGPGLDEPENPGQDSDKNA